ncbi:hypothetical protein FACS1894200_07710 [Spirochaetia bacterium]|nr:hypothetical protein FACS1894200_07710 [Spirochaetia bacterium]
MSDNDTHEHIPELSGNDYIDRQLYGKYNVKRGLRNADGTGVIVGLTRIGEVHGEKVAVPGKLSYAFVKALYSPCTYRGAAL